MSTSSVAVLLETVAHETGMTPAMTSLFERVAMCESKDFSQAVGDHNTSFGLFQIHLPAHPDVSKEEALDPVFSAQWAAKEFLARRQNEWTCTHIVEGSEGS